MRPPQVTLEATQCVEAVNQKFHQCQSINQLLGCLGLIVELRKVEGIVPHSVNAARCRASQLGYTPGTVQVVDGEGVMCAVGFAAKSVDNFPEKILSSLRKLNGMANPTHFIVAFDDTTNFRKKLIDTYKSDRKHDSLKDEIDAIKPEVVDFLRQHKIQVEIGISREADDVIASVATQCQILGEECLIVSEDKDCWQALGPKTSIYSKKKDAFYGTQWLMSTHRIVPAQVVDWLVLVGKNGVKGAEGIGEKTASELLAAYGSFVDAATQAKEGQRKAMESLDYWTARSIHTLDRRLPVGRNSNSSNDEN